MTKLTAESLKDSIRQLPHDHFTFDDLRVQVSTDYESLKDMVFALLSEPQPSVKQVFDKNVRAMRFVRVKK